MVRLRPFKFQSIAKSRLISPSSHSALFTPKPDELSVSRCGNVVQLRGKANAASAARSDPLPDRSRKRVPKDRRKAMVESYVNEYRAINDGKFPTASDAVKQVGGSYYIIREIIQELKYNLRTSSVSNRSEYSVRKDQVKDEKLFAELKDQRSISGVEDAKIHTGDQVKAFKDERADETGSSNFEAVTRSEMVCPSGDTMTHVVVKPSIQKQKNNKDLKAKDDHSVTHATQTHFHKEITQEEAKSGGKLRPDVLQESYNIQIEQVKNKLHSEHGKHEDDRKKNPPSDTDAAQGHVQNVKLNKEVNVRKPMASDALHETHTAESKTEDSSRSGEMEKIKTDTPERQSTNTDSQEKSTFWGNLKSFANGIVKIWKKL